MWYPIVVIVVLLASVFVLSDGIELISGIKTASQQKVGTRVKERLYFAGSALWDEEVQGAKARALLPLTADTAGFLNRVSEEEEREERLLDMISRSLIPSNAKEGLLQPADVMVGVPFYHFIPKGNSIEPINLEQIGEVSVETDGTNNELVAKLLISFMENPKGDAQFVFYDESCKVKKGFFADRWRHRFKFLRLKPPYDAEYIELIKWEKEQRSSLERVEFIAISVVEWLAIRDLRQTDFSFVPIEYESYKRIDSGESFSSLNEHYTRDCFLKKIPLYTTAIVNFQKEVNEAPAGFFSEGFRRIRYQGIAVVPK